MNELIKMRDTFRESADILDEMIMLQCKEETTETKKEYESVLGRFMVKMMELQLLQG